MILTAKLANLYYNDSGIKQRILGDDRNPKQIFPEEILRTILEQGQLDAVAAYKHEAIARGLPYIILPLRLILQILHLLILIERYHTFQKIAARQYMVNQSISHLLFLLLWRILTELSLLAALYYPMVTKRF